MGWVMMSERELNRVEVLAQVDDGRLTVDNAANMLALTRRQIFRPVPQTTPSGLARCRFRDFGKVGSPVQNAPNRALLGPECREAGLDEIARKQITSQGMGNYRYRTVFKPVAILPGIDLHTSIYP